MKRLLALLLVFAIGCPACLAGNGPGQKHIEMITVLPVSGVAFGQAADAPKAGTSAQAKTEPQSSVQSSDQNSASAGPGSQLAVPPAGATLGEAPDPNAIVIPAGTRIALTLKQAISTKNAREGDTVYAETATPLVLNERVLVPAGTYVQGRISHAARGGRLKGRAELRVNFTSIIYRSGYTVLLAASVENTPGADNKGMKDTEGTIQQDSDAGKKIEKAAKAGVFGGGAGVLAGALYGGLNGARIGGPAGAAAGIAWALLKRGSDLKLDVGASIEMEIQRAVPLDMSRITPARAAP
ncbi:MAG TPA: hypothetical protein VG759_13585 [Candidatus Angelobacter sp.]|nr:hypothetical protein [Candidatus Angelobacter sp.]